jgi:hypothetical protein
VDDEEQEDDFVEEDETPSSPESVTTTSRVPGVRYDGGGINVTTKSSKTNSIRIVLQRENPSEDYSIREVLIKDGSKAADGGLPLAIDPRLALQALKIKAKISKRLDSTVEAFTVPLYHHQRDEDFVNEEEVGSIPPVNNTSVGHPWRPRAANRCPSETASDKEAGDGARMVYSVAAADGSFQSSGTDITVLWQKGGKNKTPCCSYTES